MSFLIRVNIVVISSILPGTLFTRTLSPTLNALDMRIRVPANVLPTRLDIIRPMTRVTMPPPNSRAVAETLKDVQHGEKRDYYGDEHHEE